MPHAIPMPPRTKVALFGAGSRGLQCLAALRDDVRFEIAAFFDNDARKWGSSIEGRPVLEPTAAACAAMDAIIVASIHARAIVAQLTTLGVAGKIAMSPPQLLRRISGGPAARRDSEARPGDTPAMRQARLLAEAPAEIRTLAATLDVDPPPAGRRGPGWAREVACTICCNNYLAYATVLARSFLRHHPGGRFVICLADRRDAGVAYPRDPRIAIVEAAELGIAGFDALSFKYDVLEFNTAVKPYLLEWLMRQHGAERLLYLDPDILVLAPLDELFAILERTPLVLTPHLTSPYRDDHHPREVDILRAGTYNLGFAGVAAHPQTWALLEWWQARLRDGCTREVDKGYFVDQKWMDFVPSFFPEHAVLRDPGYNAAYWNLHERTIASDDGGFTVNGRTLRFFHFSGIDVDDLDAVSKHQSRVTLPASGGLRDLFELYRVLLLTHGHLERRSLPYAYGSFDNGVPVPDVVRAVYRESRLDGVQPRPFATGAGSFFEWLRTPWTEGSRISNLFAALFARSADLKAADPRVSADAELDLLLQTHVVADRYDLPAALVDTLPPAAAAPPDAVAARAPARALRRPEDRSGPHPRPIPGLAALPQIVAEGFLLAVTRARELLDSPLDVIIAAPRAPGPAAESAVDIASWLWDDTWTSTTPPVREIWVPSTYSLEGASRTAMVPVACVSLPAGAVAPSLASRESLGLPHAGLLCALVLDPLTERAYDIAATCRAFALAIAGWTAPAPSLVIGVADASHAARVMVSLRDVVTDHAALCVRALPPADLIQLLRLSDAYLALHGAVAYDPWMAHAFWHGRPAITTGAGGAADLATPSSSYLVRTLSGGPDGDPDVAHAAAQLRLALERSDERRARGARGLVEIRRTASVDVVADVMARRLRMLVPHAPAARPVQEQVA